MPAWSRSASRPLWASAPMCCSRCTLLGGVNPLLAIPTCRASSRALLRAADGVDRSSVCGAPISPSAPGLWPRCTGWCSRSSSRSAAAPAPRCTPSRRIVVFRHRMGQNRARCAHAGGARHHLLLDGAGAAWRLRCPAVYWRPAFAPGTCAGRDPRLPEIAAAGARRRHLSRQARRLCLRRRQDRR